MQKKNNNESGYIPPKNFKNSSFRNDKLRVVAHVIINNTAKILRIQQIVKGSKHYIAVLMIRRIPVLFMIFRNY